jgi:hypothetical protein
MNNYHLFIPRWTKNKFVKGESYFHTDAHHKNWKHAAVGHFGNNTNTMLESFW